MNGRELKKLELKMLKADVVFRSSVSQRNMVQLLRDVPWDASFGPSDVITLSQSDCAESSYRSSENPNKQYNVFEGFGQFCTKRGITICIERSSCR